MMDIAFGLLMYQILSVLVPILLVVFVVVPFVCNLFNGDGYWTNVRYVWGGLASLLSMGFSKRH